MKILKWNETKKFWVIDDMYAAYSITDPIVLLTFPKYLFTIFINDEILDVILYYFSVDPKSTENPPEKIPALNFTTVIELENSDFQIFNIMILLGVKSRKTFFDDFFHQLSKT